MEEMKAVLQKTFHCQIPLTRFMGIEVLEYDGHKLTLGVPIEPNLNHKCTAFGGSLYSVAVLSGWGLLFLKLKEANEKGHIVIFESSASYHHPVPSSFQATSTLPSEREFKRFMAIFKRRGKARIQLTAEIHADDAPAFTLSSSFVAIAHHLDPTPGPPVR